MALLEVQNIVKRYSKRDVVDNISLSIEEGDVVGILGENGAGKSTFMAVLATLIKPTAGDILYNGESIVRKPSIIRGKIGYVPQDIALYEEWNAYKKEKNFDEADRVRKELTERGIL